MVQATVSKVFDDLGALLTPSSTQLPGLDYMEVVTLFEKEGFLVYRGFDLDPNKLLTYTDRFTESYSGDAYRRAQRFDHKLIRNVDMGAHAVLLHSEASFTPSWPELIWFYCIVPPSKAGFTTICDGIAVWKTLSVSTRNFFMLNPIRYDLKIPTGQTRPGKGNQPWMFNTLGAANASIDWETGFVHLTQVRSAVTEGRVNGTLCFANHLVVHMDSEPQLIRRSLLDGTPVPEDIMAEVREVTDKLTKEIIWKPGDLAMIDNKRFYHGRRAYEAGDPRDIVIVQTSRANFGYGATTRTSIRR